MTTILSRRTALLSAAAAAGSSLTLARPAAACAAAADAKIRHRTVEADGVRMFYREAGPAEGPAILLLHGFPTSSHMYRNLIPALADRHRVIAPDLPGFGSTAAPPRGAYDYSFDTFAKAVSAFVDALGLGRYALYLFDYGAPVGFRLATARPERVTAIVTQNGNAYEEGLAPLWDPIRAYWTSPTPERRDALRPFLTLETTRFQHYEGVPEAMRDLVSPDAIAHDQAILDRPGAAEIQLDLFGDYRTNVALYPAWQAYLRDRRPPLLAVWGANDPIFLAEGARAFARDVPDAEIHLLDTGHFALETHGPEIAALLRDFLARRA